MRSTSYSRGNSSHSSLPWWWMGIVGAILFVLVLIRIFGSGDTDSTSEQYLSISPGEQSAVYISMTSSSKSRITGEQKLYASDKSVSVDTGNAFAKNEWMDIDLDRSSELSYISHTATGNTISLTKWRAWVSVNSLPLTIVLNNYTAIADSGSVLMIEQNWVYSNIYALKNTLTILAGSPTTSLEPGNMLSLHKSDLVNPNSSITEWIRAIDDSIQEYPLFTRNNGTDFLQNLPASSDNSGSGSTTDSLGWSGNLSITTDSYIRITEPKAGILSKTNTIVVMGDLLSREVKRVTINNVDAVVSPVNETFVLQDISVTSEIFDIVYKAYDTNNTLLQSGVLTIFGPKWSSTTSSSPLVPETFPVSGADFKITYPTTNPYSTTTGFIKVQWSVPKNTVEYIVVNDYRLQKYIPKSTTWYYFANTETWTMKDGFNLYTIKFYGANNTLLYTQPFTIIKESKNVTVSGE